MTQTQPVFSKSIATRKAAKSGAGVGTSAGAAALLAPVLAAWLRRQWPDAPWGASEDLAVSAAILGALGAFLAATSRWVANWRKHS